MKIATNIETRTCNQEATVEDTTAITNKTPKVSKEKKKAQGSLKRRPEHPSKIKQENRKKVNGDKTAKIPFLGASSSGGVW